VVGLIIVGHGDFPRILVNSAEEIVGPIERLRVVSFYSEGSKNSCRIDLRRAIKNLESPDGILLLADMFGGTPCNVSVSLQKAFHLKIITGLNLPMLLEAVLHRGKEVGKLTKIVKESAIKSIIETW